MLLLDQLAKIIPTNKEPDAWLSVLNELLVRYDINTPRRLAGFLAQSAHESADFKLLEENLNYSASGLQKTWPSRFTSASAAEYARKPEKIANKVYADRMGNGSEASGDGWRFRGRGIKQLTGRSNYTAFGKTVNMTAEQAAEYLTSKQGAVESAVWFWKANNLNRYADADDILGMTKAINGGTNGLEDRTKRYEAAKKILEQTVLAPTATSSATIAIIRTLRRGDRGDDVKVLQRFLNLTADGIFGVGTESMARNWQKQHGLTADGVVGPMTRKAMFGL